MKNGSATMLPPSRREWRDRAWTGTVLGMPGACSTPTRVNIGARPSRFKSLARERGSSQRLDGELIEVRDAVGLGPQRDLAGVDERRIGRAEQRLVVEPKRERGGFAADRHLVPLARRHREGLAGKLLAPTLDRAVEAH